MKNTFWAIFISLALGIISIFAAFYIWRTYVYYPQQEYLSKQFETMNLQLQDLSENLERKNWGQEIATLTELNEEVKVILEKKNKELARQAAIPKDWETYSDKTWGIEFAYPAEWKVYERPGENYDLLLVKNTLGEETSIDKREKLADWQIINKNTGEVYENILDLVMADLRELSVLWNFVDGIEFGDYTGHVYLEGPTVYNYGVLVETEGAFYQIILKGRDENLTEEEELFLKSIKFLK